LEWVAAYYYAADKVDTLNKGICPLSIYLPNNGHNALLW